MIPQILTLAVAGAVGSLARAVAEEQLKSFAELQTAIQQCRVNMMTADTLLKIAETGKNLTEEQRGEFIKNAGITAASGRDQIKRAILKLATPLPAALRTVILEVDEALSKVVSATGEALKGLPAFIAWHGLLLGGAMLVGGVVAYKVLLKGK